MMNIRVPYLKQPIGLGDAVQSATKAAGVSPCGGCHKRKAALNRAVTLVPAARRVGSAAALPTAKVGEPYSALLPDLVTGGAIAPGLAVDPHTKELHGIPAAAGVFTLNTRKGKFSIEVRG